MGLQMKLLKVKKIWNKAPHNAMTDLLWFKDRWLCTFRESDSHQQGENGKIRVISSRDGERWRSVALISERGVDLRDPKFSIMPDGRIMLLMGGTVLKDLKYFTMQPRVAFSENGTTWSRPRKILYPHEWLWRVTWYNGAAYGFSYSFSDPKDLHKKWVVKLFKTFNGIDYTLIKTWRGFGRPNEGTIRFQNDGTMVVLLRRDRSPHNQALIGTSKAPYKNWKWNKTKHYFGGPNFLILEDDTMLAAGRIFRKEKETTTLAKMTLKGLHPVLDLPSGGDTSYPGMVLLRQKLWMSYYSSHESNTAIYLAQIKI